MFRKKKEPASPLFDPATQELVIRCSICTGEMTAALADKATGHLS